ncbi:MAG: cytidylate kinase-like family protein [Marinilabiliaceae bacterium]|nr:cytidylate kinase-like family protein [Marinilabiliaceae bacterium]
MDKLYSYFDQRYGEIPHPVDNKNCGPIITISRQTGCDAVLTARKLVERLNREYSTTKWHWVDKQILIEAAKELKTDSARVRSYLEGSEFSGLSDMINAISGDYISNARIRKAISRVVISICQTGYAVLVGRGGVAITRQLEKALHIRLVAPFYWRVENIIRKRKFGIEEAEEFVVDTDEKRHNLILNFLDKKPLNIDYLFDATINRSSYSVDQLADIILDLYKKRISAIKDGLVSGGKGLNKIYG